MPSTPTATDDAPPSAATPTKPLIKIVTWSERHRSIIGSVGAVGVSLVAALSGHIVELMRLILEHGWQAVLLVGALALVLVVLRFVAEVRDSMRTLMEEFALREDHKRDAAVRLVDHVVSIKHEQVMGQLAALFDHLRVPVT